ncbi:CHAP domain-containing protein [candidate division KSB1 bacterium]|nr:CHAP domain-containing protein [candidate division KSB1 bacterium]
MVLLDYKHLAKPHYEKKRRRTPKKLLAGLFLMLVVAVAAALPWMLFKKTYKVGDVIDSFNGVTVFYNGENGAANHGRHYSEDGYYFGQRWQCVEFVKRYYYQVLSHKMPEVWGHATDFFEPELEDGTLNSSRDLLQYRNGGSEKPRADDIIVFRHNGFGHVAIVAAVYPSSIEIIQQNKLLKSREKLPLINTGGRYTVGGEVVPAGWLRKPS